MFTGIDTGQKFTYTVLYKELNAVLRELELIDVQEIIFSRMLMTDPGKEFLFQTNKNGISYSLNAYNLYLIYDEGEELFQLPEVYQRYNNFYGNMYIARSLNESDIIGYYVGDSTTSTEFIHNYGQFDYQKMEIYNFLAIYKSTRDYYYKVLLNKSFIQEDEYMLFEKLFISFVAIERFLNSKIENLRDPDFFNATDIYNFLESYGLGVLNAERYNFVIGGKDYKLNINNY